MRLALPVICFAVLASAGCATMDAEACRKANWYEVGYRDGLIYTMQPQDNLYTHQCGQIDAASYRRGWQEGKWEADARKSDSMD